MSNLGLASIITDCVSVHGAWREFKNRFPDRTNMTFEETDGELDRSHESLGAAFKTRQDGSGNTQRMIAPCIVRIGMGCKDTNRESLCGLPVLKTKTHGSIILLSEKVLFHILSEVFMSGMMA